VRDKELPLDQAVCLFEKQIGALAASAKAPANALFKAALTKKVPTGPITTQALAQLLQQVTEEIAETSATDYALLREERQEKQRLAHLEAAEKKRRQKKA
jgi:hypothetical protein